ncbi:hypothetical protein HY970_02940 [Candidatus Kaiserbacteria bacterium]|nr:hypothetical protein [Candidatus Kaiserbacteria bacterium]
MQSLIGLALAFLTLIAWGAGDFFIQRSSRQIGIWKSLFAISFFGTIIPLPFLIDRIALIWDGTTGLLLLSTLGFVIFLAALFEFEALKRGKLSIIEPVFGLEIPITLGLAVSLGFDHITLLQQMLVLATGIGVVLAVIDRRNTRTRKYSFEKGVILAGIGAAAMALTNFLTGVGSREVDPFATIWFINAFLSAASLAVIIIQRDFHFLRDIRTFYGSILGESIFDNLAWFSYAYSMTLIPISISTAITESYIGLSVLIGVFANRERMEYWQIAGVMLTVACIVGLSATLAN